MKLTVRKKGSQRAGKPIPVTIHENWVGRDGENKLILESEDSYFIIEPDDYDDSRKLVSAAHIAMHNSK